MSNSVHANNKIRSILNLGKDFIQGIDNTAIYAEKMYSTNFTVDSKKFCLISRYNGDSSYLFANSKKIINFKAKDFEIVPYPLCLENISKDFDLRYMEKNRINWIYLYFSVDYWAIANDKILDIDKYLMEKSNII